MSDAHHEGRFAAAGRCPARGVLTGRTRPRAWVLGVAVIAVVSITAAACARDEATPSVASSNVTSATDPDEGPPAEGGSATVGVAGETPGWNPHDSQWAAWSILVGSSMLEPLATIDKDLNPIPWLATSWTPNETFDSYTIKVRANVTFQNGERFDAAAVKLNIDDATTAALSGTALKKLVREVTVTDPTTLQVDLTQPWATFPNIFLTSQGAFMMAPAMLRSSDRGASHPIGTGPFTFASWTKDSSFKTTRNASYWQAGKPHLDELNFAVISDASSQSSSLQAGNIDMMVTGSYQAATTLERSGFAVLKDWQSLPGMAMTNTAPDLAGTPNPVANVHARKALAYATDQQALAEIVGPGLNLPKSPIPSASKWGLPDDQTGYPDHDLDQAKQQVDQYKRDTGESSLSIELSFPSDSDSLVVAQALQSQWKQAGIDTTITAKLASAFIADVVVGKYQVALFSIYNAPDPDFYNLFWSSANIHPYGEISINFTKFTTPQMDRDLKVGRQNPDFDARKRAYDDVVKQINENAVNIWTFYSPFSIIADSHVRGLQKARETSFVSGPKTWLGDLWLSTQR